MQASLARPCQPIRLAALLALVLVALAACSGQPAQAPPSPTPAQALPAGAGGTLIMTLGARDPTTLDPALVGDVTSALVARQVFSGLVRLDGQLEVEPDLAERWELSADGRTYTFYLRPTARFADGAPLTAEDVRYSLERATDPSLARSLPARTYLGDIVGVREKIDGGAATISGVQVIDERTLAITIDAPKSYFLAKLTHPTSFVVDRRAVEAGGATWTDSPNGSGPFFIEEWRHDELLVLARNPGFYRDPAMLDRVRFLMGAAANNPMVLYEQGEIDVTSVAPIDLARVQDASNPLSRELVSVPQLSLYYLGMNVTRPPFDDPKVREAFTLLIDRAKLATVALSGAARPAYGILPPGMPGYDPAITPVSADAQRARALIAESRYGSPAAMPPIVAYGGLAGTLRDVAEESLGISIEVRDYESSGDFFAALSEAQFQIYGSGWIADYPDPENFLDVLFRGGSAENHTGYDSAAVNDLLSRAATEKDEAARFALYRQAERQILADAPVIPLYHNI
ncbi:MAG: peptide ABC transporter substrate-binding protein, partial [Chloroflexales bacterium]|nr:peptide ABC transporter substrate-binding protein [Chloroflexales bacterium]